MKKWFCILFAVVFGLTFLGCDAETEREKNDVSISVESDSVIDNWYEYISEEEYREIEDLFLREQWVELEEIRFDEYNAAMIFRLYGSGRPIESIYLYHDDVVTVSKATEEEGFFKSKTYQMPTGVCKNAETALQQYYQKQHDIVTNFQTFFPDFFAADFEIYWMLDAKEVYSDPEDVPEFYSDDPELYLEIGAQEMYCEGSGEIGNEILALFGEISSWEEIPFDMDWLSGVYSRRSFQFQCDELKGDEYCIDVWRYDDDHTCVSVNNYAAFLAPAELYSDVENVLREHEEQWEIIPVSE